MNDINDNEKLDNCLANKGLSSKEKWIITLIAFVTFLIFSSPIFLRILSPIFRIFNIDILYSTSSPQNSLCVTFIGYILSAICFSIFVRIFMH